MLLASGVMALMSGVISPGDAFARVGLARSLPAQLRPDHRRLHCAPQRGGKPGLRGDRRSKKQQPAVPIVELFKKHWLLVILAALVFAGNNAAGYMTTGGYVLSYATNPKGLAMDRTEVLLAVTVSAAIWFIFTLVAGFLADSIGRKNTYLIGLRRQLLTRLPAVLAGQHRQHLGAVLGWRCSPSASA